MFLKINFVFLIESSSKFTRLQTTWNVLLKCCLQVKKLFAEIVKASDYKNNKNEICCIVAYNRDIFKKLNYQHFWLNYDKKLLPKAQYVSIVQPNMQCSTNTAFWAWWQFYASLISLPFIVFIMSQKRTHDTVQPRPKIKKVGLRRKQKWRYYARHY